MARPRKAEPLVPITGRIRDYQKRWLEWEAERRFEGEMSRTLRWSLDQARVFSILMMHDDPVTELDRMLNPEKYEHDVYDGPSEDELRAERLRRERAIARAYSYEDVPDDLDPKR
jgi:hypothetical protein